MKKRELLRLPVLGLTDEMLVHALSKEREKEYIAGSKPYYDALRQSTIWRRRS